MPVWSHPRPAAARCRGPPHGPSKRLVAVLQLIAQLFEVLSSAAEKAFSEAACCGSRQGVVKVFGGSSTSNEEFHREFNHVKPIWCSRCRLPRNMMILSPVQFKLLLFQPKGHWGWRSDRSALSGMLRSDPVEKTCNPTQTHAHIYIYIDTHTCLESMASILSQLLAPSNRKTRPCYPQILASCFAAIHRRAPHPAGNDPPKRENRYWSGEN